MALLRNHGFLLPLLLLALLGNASAATYVVGDSLGWRVPNSPADYSNWASQHVFAVGDVLVFNFVSGAHDVAQVTKASFDNCSSNNPLSLATLGPSNITLNSAGETFFICTFGSHCSLGQKLDINVSAASAPSPAPTPTPTTAPVPPPTRSPAPAPSTSSPTPTPSPAQAPTPSGSGSPSTSPPMGLAPGSTTSPGDLTPPSPPPPSSATIWTSSSWFALVAIGLMIM